jgi:hypothetical protein
MCSPSITGQVTASHLVHKSDLIGLICGQSSSQVSWTVNWHLINHQGRWPEVGESRPLPGRMVLAVQVRAEFLPLRDPPKADRSRHLSSEGVPGLQVEMSVECADG